MEGNGMTIPFRVEKNDLYPFMLNPITDGYGATKPTPSAVVNTQLLHLSLGHLNITYSE